MRSSAARAESGGQQHGLGNFFFAGPGLLRVFRMNFDAVHALRGMCHCDRNQLTIFSRDAPIFPCDDSIKIRSRSKILRRELRHFL